MDIFKRPELSDRQWVSDLLAQEGCPACEYSFASIFLWADAYRERIAQVGGRLLVQLADGSRPYHLFPAGTGPLSPALEAARASSQAQNAPLTLICLTAEQKVRLEAQFPGCFRFEPDRDGFDYLYSAKKLALLSGKKLHAKRNHISRFCDRFPDWLFEPIGPDQAAECADMARAWFQSKAPKEHRGLLPEEQALSTALTHMDTLGLFGGLIRAGGEVVAFSLACMLNEHCCDVLFEKARADLQGAYPVINRELARCVCRRLPDVEYLNREDDMGLPGLRKAKLSYYPDLLLEKYTACQIQAF